MKKILLTSIVGLTTAFGAGMAYAEDPKINYQAIFDVAEQVDQSSHFGYGPIKAVLVDSLHSLAEATQNWSGVTLYELMLQMKNKFGCNNFEDLLDESECSDLIYRIVARHNELLEIDYGHTLGEETDFSELLSPTHIKIYSSDARYYAVLLETPLSTQNGMLKYAFYKTGGIENAGPTCLSYEGAWCAKNPTADVKLAVYGDKLVVEPLTPDYKKSGEEIIFFDQMKVYDQHNRELVHLRNGDMDRFRELELIEPKEFKYINRGSSKYSDYVNLVRNYNNTFSSNQSEDTEKRMNYKNQIDSMEADFDRFTQSIRSFRNNANRNLFVDTQTQDLAQAEKLVQNYFVNFTGYKNYMEYTAPSDYREYGTEERPLGGLTCGGKCNSIPGTQDNVICSLEVDGIDAFLTNFVFDDICDESAYGPVPFQAQEPK
ncbi:MAG: hypothetical protein J6R22_03635 [Alphaproteobacteria bacterium]|nr:hypothetical protein [Alphaproteobacteria bacterium]